MVRKIVLVSGAPGAGKTALAVPLARELGMPLLSKDDIKETLWGELFPSSVDLEWSRKIGAASMEVLWTLSARCPAAVLDAPFRPHSDPERKHLASLNAELVEVFCRCSPAVALQRYAERAHHRHATHVRRTLTAKDMEEFDGPMRLGPVIGVNTEAAVDITALVRRVIELLVMETPAEAAKESSP